MIETCDCEYKWKNDFEIAINVPNIARFGYLVYLLNSLCSSSEHFSYQKHACTSAHKKDFQVPACPLCGEPVPTPRGVSPDMTVGQHIGTYH